MRSYRKWYRAHERIFPAFLCYYSSSTVVHVTSWPRRGSLGWAHAQLCFPHFLPVLFSIFFFFRTLSSVLFFPVLFCCVLFFSVLFFPYFFMFPYYFSVLFFPYFVPHSFFPLLFFPRIFFPVLFFPVLFFPVLFQKSRRLKSNVLKYRLVVFIVYVVITQFMFLAEYSFKRHP